MHMQVSSSADSAAPVRLARMIAMDAQQYKTRRSTEHLQKRISSSFMTPPPSIANIPSRHSDDTTTSSTADQLVCEDDVAYLSPALAFNLNLQHQLWPLMPQLKAVTQLDRQSVIDAQASSMIRNSIDANFPPSSDVSVVIRPLRQLTNMRTVDVLQSGNALANCISVYGDKPSIT